MRRIFSFPLKSTEKQGGEGDYWLIQQAGLDLSDAFTGVGYGLDYGVLKIAPVAKLDGRANVIVNGDHYLVDLGVFTDIPIITASQSLNKLKQE